MFLSFHLHSEPFVSSFRTICIFLHVGKQLLRQGTNVLAGNGSSLLGISVRAAVGREKSGILHYFWECGLQEL